MSLTLKKDKAKNELMQTMRTPKDSSYRLIETGEKTIIKMTKAILVEQKIVHSTL